MTYLVDTCGWIEWLTEGSLVTHFAPYLKNPKNILIPTIVQFELYKWMCREKDESTALNIISITQAGQVTPLDSPLALLAAEVSSQYKLAMTNAIIYACSLQNNVSLVTSDHHFKGLANVKYFYNSKAS